MFIFIYHSDWDETIMEEIVSQKDTPNPTCDLCSHPMKQCNIYTERFAFRALFTQYICNNGHDTPETREKYLDKISDPNGEQLNDREEFKFISKIKCNICAEISSCKKNNIFARFIYIHCHHLYTRIIKSYPLYYNYFITDYYFSLTSEYKPAYIHPIPPGESWRDLERKKRLVKFDIDDVSTEVIFSCSADILTYNKVTENNEKKMKSDKIQRCICCDSAYLKNTNSIEIYEHFVKCLEKNKKQYIELIGVYDLTEEEKNILNSGLYLKKRLKFISYHDDSHLQ